MMTSIIYRSNRYLLFNYLGQHVNRFIRCEFSIGNHDNVNNYTVRTHTCGQLTKADIGKRVELYGWLQYSRFNNKILILRDSYGTTQCILDKRSSSYSTIRKTTIPNESVLHISGLVKERPYSQGLGTGSIEILTENVRVLGKAKSNLPLLARENPPSKSTSNTNRLKYRYLDLRSCKMQNSLRVRSKACKIIRDKLLSMDFVECETPTLLNRTPGGANEFIVPTQTPDRFYSLTQSPQQLKQMLMIGGLDRYFQICKCYRDEPNRSDRQPEFTQVDIELSFTNQKLIMKLIDDLIHHLFSQLFEDKQITSSLVSSFNSDRRLPTITFGEAFKLYGTDKPDLRVGWSIEDTDEGKLCLDVPHQIDRGRLDDIISKIKSRYLFGLELNYEVDGLNSRTKFVCPSGSDEARALLGATRKTVIDDLSIHNDKLFDRSFSLLWITEFPLFAKDANGFWTPNHHPFTAPTVETSSFLKQNPSKVIGQHYDLVMNGQEVAGGSIRINDSNLQRIIIEEVMRTDARLFEYFLDALESGCPPHGGIAIGLDRLISIVLGFHSIKDVIAFPKSSEGRDLMTDCPQEISPAIKKLYHLK